MKRDAQNSIGQFHGFAIRLSAFSGARGVRVVHPAHQSIVEHRHDSACLTIHALGSGVEAYDGAEVRIAGPSAILHCPGSPHLDRIGALGLETVSIEFDALWLRLAGCDIRLDRSRHWQGGMAGNAARRLARSWLHEKNEIKLARATALFLEQAMRSVEPPHFSWLEAVSKELDAESPPSTLALARRFELHPAWLARAYRSAVGEGLAETVRRNRVQRAIDLLRRTDVRLADIAATAGFCDQSHMNRSFREILDRTPLEIRAERALLSEAGGSRISGDCEIPRRWGGGSARSLP